VLQGIAACYSVLQCAMKSSDEVKQCVAVYVAVCCSAL